MGALNPGGHIDRLAGLVQRRSLFPRLVRPVFVIVPRVRGEDLPEVLFAVDQEVVEALAAPSCVSPLAVSAVFVKIAFPYLLDPHVIEQR